MRRIHSIRRSGAIAATLATVLAATLAGAQSPTATATITHHDAPVRGFRQGDDFLMPLAAVGSVGWSAGGRGETVRLVAEERTMTLPVLRVGGTRCVSLKAVARELGALTDWLAGYDAYEMMAPLTSVTAKGGALSVRAKMGVVPRVQTLSNPTRVVVDLDGARYSRSTELSLEDGARIYQYRANSVRIVYELPFPPTLPEPTERASARLDFQFDPDYRAPAPPVKATPYKWTPPPVAPPDATPDEPSAPIAPSSDPVELRLKTELSGDTATLLTLASPTAALKAKPTIRKPQPDVLEIVLPGIVGRFPEDTDFSNGAVRSASATVSGKSTVVRLELTGAMGGEVWTDARGVAIQLLRPAIANGRIAGKVVVIDAGHGGKASGCTYGSLTEKSLTLAIAKYTSVELANLGATVIMTRKDDSNPDLVERPNIANRNRADLFISIHINSPGSDNRSARGAQVYYHKADGISKLLGECLMRYMVRYGGVVNSGVKSDSVLYKKSGLAVLRGARMPAVLVEVGFITNPGDRAKMTNPDFQRQIARSVADGVRLFLGDKGAE